MSMDSLEIIVTGRGSDVSNDFPEPILIPTDYEAKIGLKRFSTYNNIPNITKGVNNQLKIRVPGGKYSVFSLETGAYELEVIAEQMIEWIGMSNPKLQAKDKFRLIGNNATSKADFYFLDDYGVDFNVDASMHVLLGFDKTDKFEGIGRYVGKRIVSITNVTQLIFNCNISTSNYISGREMPFLYNCSIDVPAGYRLARELTDIVYKTLTTTQISHIRIWIVDEHGVPVNLRDDDLAVTLSLKLKRRVIPVSLCDDDTESASRGA